MERKGEEKRWTKLKPLSHQFYGRSLEDSKIRASVARYWKTNIDKARN